MIPRVIDWPPVWLAGFMAVAWVLGQLGAPLRGALVWPGVALIAAGVVLIVWAAVEFRRARTTIVPREEPSALVERGPFRFSRNPIYLADLVILAGWVMVTGQPAGLVLVPVLGAILARRFIEPEEAMLERHLGAPFRAYRARVRRWL